MTTASQEVKICASGSDTLLGGIKPHSSPIEVGALDPQRHIQRQFPNWEKEKTAKLFGDHCAIKTACSKQSCFLLSLNFVS